jgi:hypothetical protein
MSKIRNYFVEQITEVLDQTGEFLDFNLVEVCESMKCNGFDYSEYSNKQIAEAFYSALGIVVGRTL